MEKVKNKLDLLIETFLLTVLCICLSTLSTVIHPTPEMESSVFLGLMFMRRLVVVLSFILPITIFNSYVKGNRNFFKQFKTEKFTRNILTSLVAGVTIFVLWIASLIFQYSSVPSLTSCFTTNHASKIYGLKFPAVLLFQYVVFEVFNQFMVAFSEEYLFRGFLQKNLMEVFGCFQGYLVASVVFCLAHFLNPSYTIYQLFFEALPGGLILGYLYYRTKNLTTPVLAHYIGNLLQRVLTPFFVF